MLDKIVRHGGFMKFDDMELYDIARRNIRKYRKLRGYTQEEFAEKINYTVWYVQEIESTTKNKTFSLIVISRSAKVLGIKPEKILEK